MDGLTRQQGKIPFSFFSQIFPVWYNLYTLQVFTRLSGVKRSSAKDFTVWFIEGQKYHDSFRIYYFEKPVSLYRGFL
jgi:hypothetical protein